MPNLVISSGIDKALETSTDQLSGLFNGAFVTGFSPTEITAISIFGSIVATGTDFAATPMREITGGTFQSVTFACGIDGVDTITWTEIDLPVLSLVQAFEDESSDTPDIAAVENLLFPLDWDITFNDQSDFLPRSARTEDDVLVHFQGDDRFDLQGGDDVFFSSGGRDTVLGGDGNIAVFYGITVSELEFEFGLFLVG